jgi:hypothetical protein
MIPCDDVSHFESIEEILDGRPISHFIETSNQGDEVPLVLAGCYQHPYQHGPYTHQLLAQVYPKAHHWNLLLSRLIRLPQGAGQSTNN